MQGSRVWPAISGRNLDEEVFWPGLGVFEKDIEVTLLVKDPGVQQLELEILVAAAAVLLDQPLIGIGGLGIFVQHPHVAVSGCAVQVEVYFLDVFAVVPLRPGQAEQPLFEDRVLAVPAGESETQVLLAVADTREPVLSPAVHPAAGMVVGK